MKDVTFLLPAYNEEKSIGALLDNIKKLYPDSRIIVIDNNSSDKTSEIAKKAGANVIFEGKQGKGHAVKKGFENVNSDFVVMLDGDNTYDPGDAKKIIKPLMDDKADLVLGSRFLEGKHEVPKYRRIGQEILNFTINFLAGTKLTDSQSGFRALSNKVVKSIELSEGGFAVEAEMIIQASKHGFKIVEVPIYVRYHKHGSTLNPVIHGFGVLFRILILTLKPVFQR